MEWYHLNASPTFNSIEWIHELGEKAEEFLDAVYFQFHWMDSPLSAIRRGLCSNALSIPLNGFGKRAVAYEYVGYAKSFNSIEWIRRREVRDSVRSRLHRLSIPLNGFQGYTLKQLTPGWIQPFNSIEWIRKQRHIIYYFYVSNRFQFHWMDSPVDSVRVAVSPALFQFHWMDSPFGARWWEW